MSVEFDRQILQKILAQICSCRILLCIFGS